MSKKRVRRYLRMMGVLVLVTILVLPACTVPDSAYKTMTVKNYLANFSFEYRAYYRNVDGPSIVDSASEGLTVVSVAGPKRQRPAVNPEPGSKGQVVQMSYDPAALEVVAADASKYPPSTPDSRVDDALRSWSTFSQFKLLERSTTTVAGVPAEFIVYQIDPPFPGWPLAYHAVAYFDQGGLHWSIEAMTDVTMADAVRADFDHVLATLKIYD